MKPPITAIFQNLGLFVVLIATTTLVAAWSFGISALIRKELDPGMPQWLIIIAVAAALVGAMILIGRFMRSASGQRISQTLIVCLLMPLLATVFGGAYLWVSERFSHGREPAATSILAIGLGSTVFGFGIATSMEPGHMISVFACSLSVLLLLRFHFPKAPLGTFRFGALHVFSLISVMVIASIEDAQRQRDRPGLPLLQNTRAESSGRVGRMP